MQKQIANKMKTTPVFYFVQRGFALVAFVSVATVHATAVRSWNFEEGSIAVAVSSATDSVSGLVAVTNANNGANIPQYISGNGGGTAVDFSSVDGVLEVADDAKILGAYYSDLTVTFDVNLAADATNTWVLLRNGHADVPFNIYLLNGNIIGFQLESTDGILASGRTAGSALSATAGWQTVSAVWDGTAISILVDGVAQTLQNGNTSIEVPVTSLILSDAPMGIGGIVRKNGSIGQFLNGSIDNIVIEGTRALPPSIEMTVVASWDFNGGSIGADILSATDSISGLAAVPNINNAANPQYVSGNGGDTGAGFGGIDGVLQADDPTGTGIIGAGFTALRVTFDVDLESDLAEGGPVVFLRNGHLDENFNIYGLSNNIIGVTMKDADGTTSSGSIRTVGPALSAAAGWQTVSVVWDGESIWILVDGVAQPLTGGGTSARIALVSLLQADTPLGIGGLVRADGTTGQYLNGKLDNILVEGVRATSPVVEISDMTIGAVDNSNILVSWMGDSATTYTLQRTSDLISDSWSNVVENVPGIDAMMSVTNYTTAPQAFYRTIAE